MTSHPNRSRTLKAIKRYLHLDIDSGSRFVGPDDIDRALTAADIALTAGWHNPNAASCTLYAEDVL